MNRKWIVPVLFGLSVVFMSADEKGCHESSDDIQRRQQENILAEGTAEIGMPAIKNFRERRIMKDIYELRDQANYITYAHLQSEQTGKLCYLGESIGYPIPYATQFTNPMKWVGNGAVMPQADPNGLFSPSSAEGTWVMMRNPLNGKVAAVYIEPKVTVAPWRMTNRSCFE